MKNLPAPSVGAQVAIISDCQRYRYWLSRVTSLSYGARVLFVMLNPSTADHMVDDPTIRRVRQFATAMNAAQFGVVNLFAMRATDPKELKTGADPAGPLNDTAIERGMEWADIVVAAWGATPKAPRWFAELHKQRVDFVIQCAAIRKPGGLHALATTDDGAPRHPLYLRNDCRPLPWPLPHDDDHVFPPVAKLLHAAEGFEKA